MIEPVWSLVWLSLLIGCYFYTLFKFNTRFGLYIYIYSYDLYIINIINTNNQFLRMVFLIWVLRILVYFHRLGVPFFAYTYVGGEWRFILVCNGSRWIFVLETVSMNCNIGLSLSLRQPNHSDSCYTMLKHSILPQNMLQS